MGYKIKSLTLENMVVFTQRTVIDFTKDGINLIEGQYLSNETQSNGVGKSLIIDGICLALFGKGLRASYLNDYISSSNPSGGIYVGLELIDENNTNIKIERWKRPNSEVNKAKLWKNSVCISQDSTISKIDEAIQGIVGVNHANFLSCIFTVMLSGFTKLRPAQRFELLEQALAVKKIESVIKKINVAIKGNEDSIFAINNIITEKNNRYIAETTKKEIYCSNIEAIKENIIEHERTLIEHRAQEKVLSDKTTQTKNFLTDCNKQLTPLEAEIKELVAQKRVKEVNRDNLKLKKTAVLKSFKKNNKGTLECSICNSSLTEQSKEQVSTHYDEEIANINVEIVEIIDFISEKEAKSSKINVVKDKTEKVYNKLINSLNFTQTSMIAIEKALSNAKDSLELASSSFNDALLKKLEKDLSELRDNVKASEKQLTMNNAWKQIMSKNGLRLSYIKEEVSTLNALSSQYATALYETPTQIKFFINDERDNPALDFTVNGKNASLFSTGEKGRLEIAMTLSLLSLLKTAGLNLECLILDEAMDGLSESSKLAVLKVIEALSSEYQILMISHDDIMKTKPGHIIQVVKDSTTNISTVSTYTRK